jgi:acyl-coenzyme A synthetase/AMP-(fatty) acid ligase
MWEGPSPDEGVLYMRSPMLMEGYNNLPDKTADAVREGWYRSGDIMRRDENGFFHFVGRADDMFVVGGENVWPGEVERLLEQMPGVHQAAVVPVPDEIKGALPFAFVVPQAGASFDEAAVKAFARPRSGLRPPALRLFQDGHPAICDQQAGSAPSGCGGGSRAAGPASIHGGDLTWHPGGS